MSETTNLVTFPEALAPVLPPKRTRNFHPPGPTLDEAKVRLAEIEGKPVAFLGLGGRGYGSEMVIDAADLDLVLSISPSWTLGGRLRGRHPGYVVSGCRAAQPLAKQPGSEEPVAVLARVLMKATKAEVVRYKSLDTCDLRRRNLYIVGRSEFLSGRDHHPLPTS